MLKDMDNLLRMEKISKSFPGVKALDSVHFELKRGEVHAIAGENGAGKSTFMKVLTGIYKQDEGEIYYKGNLFLPENPKHAQEMGISIIHQELNLLPDLSVANNIYISREPRKVRGIIDDKEMNEKAQALLDSMGLSINAQTEVKDLSIASRQMVEIAKALSVQSDVLVLDEPTSSLSLSETETLFNIIRKLRDEGVGIIYISHRLEEFDDIVDRVTMILSGAISLCSTLLDAYMALMFSVSGLYISLSASSDGPCISWMSSISGRSIFQSSSTVSRSLRFTSCASVSPSRYSMTIGALGQNFFKRRHIFLIRSVRIHRCTSRSEDAASFAASRLNSISHKS